MSRAELWNAYVLVVNLRWRSIVWVCVCMIHDLMLGTNVVDEQYNGGSRKLLPSFSFGVQFPWKKAATKKKANLVDPGMIRDGSIIQ